MYRVAFEERRQGLSKKFDKFYISLKCLENSADLYGTCVDARMATRIMAGICDTETKKKLQAINSFPTAQDIVNICRSEASAKSNERALSGQSTVSFIKHQPSLRPGGHSCGACGRTAHLTRRHVINVGYRNIFPCDARNETNLNPATPVAVALELVVLLDPGAKPNASITISCVQSFRGRRIPTISVKFSQPSPIFTPNPGMEVTVGSSDVLLALGLK